MKSNSLTFNGSGQLVSPTGNVGGITISGLADGANPLTFAWNLFTAPTQRTLRLGVISSANVRAKPQLQ